MQRVHDELDVLPRQGVVHLVVLEALQRHDRRDLPLRDQLAAEVQQRRQVRGRQVVRLVRVHLSVGRVVDVGRRRTRGHQGVAGERCVLLVVAGGSGSSTEIFGVVAAGCFEALHLSVQIQSKE